MKASFIKAMARFGVLSACVLAPLLLFPPVSVSKENTALHGELLDRYGQFSDEYFGNWKGLSVGIQKEALDSFLRLESNPPRNLEIHIENRTSVTIEGKRIVKTWRSAQPKYKGSTIYVRNSGSVTLQDLVIELRGEQYAGYDTILIEDANQVIIRNVKISGSAQGYHIRVVGAEEVFIENVLINGQRVGDGKSINAGGILIENGAGGSRNPRQNQITVVQNVSIANYTSIDKYRNQDAINVTSPRLLLLFNCYVNNYGVGGKVADGSLDLSFRQGRGHDGYALVERNVFQAGYVIKTPGAGDQENAAVWRNNLIIDTQFAAYNENWTNYLINNTFVNKMQDAFIRLWGIKDTARLVLFNNVFSSKNPRGTFVFASAEHGTGKDDRLVSWNNTIMIPRTSSMSEGPGILSMKSASQWQDRVGPTDRVVLGNSLCEIENSKYQLKVSRHCVSFSSNSQESAILKKREALSPERDFSGMPRNMLIPVGAFDPRSVPDEKILLELQ